MFIQCDLSPVIGGNPLGPGAPKGSNSGTSVVSALALAMGTAVRPRFVTFGGGPEGTGVAGEGVGVVLWSDMVVIVQGGCSVAGLEEESGGKTKHIILSLDWRNLKWLNDFRFEKICSLKFVIHAVSRAEFPSCRASSSQTHLLYICGKTGRMLECVCVCVCSVCERQSVCPCPLYERRGRFLKHGKIACEWRNTHGSGLRVWLWAGCREVFSHSSPWKFLVKTDTFGAWWFIFTSQIFCVFVVTEKQTRFKQSINHGC